MVEMHPLLLVIPPAASAHTIRDAQPRLAFVSGAPRAWDQMELGVFWGSVITEISATSVRGIASYIVRMTRSVMDIRRNLGGEYISPLLPFALFDSTPDTPHRRHQYPLVYSHVYFTTFRETRLLSDSGITVIP